MWDWLNRQWADIRGNAKWDLTKWLATPLICGLLAAGYSLWSKFRPLSLPVQVLSVVTILLSFGCMGLFGLLLREKKRNSKEQPIKRSPPFESALVVSQNTGGSLATSDSKILTAKSLRIKYEPTGRTRGGVRLRLVNVGIKVLQNCRLKITMFSIYNTEYRAFAEPTFAPSNLINVPKLEPGQETDDKWLARVVASETIRVPQSGGNYFDHHTGGRWRANFIVEADGILYEDYCELSWQPGHDVELKMSPPGQYT